MHMCICLISFDSHKTDKGFLSAFFKVLRAITAEPAHAIRASSHDIGQKTLDTLATLPMDGTPERRSHPRLGYAEASSMTTVLDAVAVLANCAQEPMLRAKLMQHDATDLFFRVLRAPLRDGSLHAEAFRMASGLARDGKYLARVAPRTECPMLLQVIEATIHLGLFAPLPHCVDVLCALLIHAHRGTEPALHGGASPVAGPPGGASCDSTATSEATAEPTPGDGTDAAPKALSACADDDRSSPSSGMDVVDAEFMLELGGPRVLTYAINSLVVRRSASRDEVY